MGLQSQYTRGRGNVVLFLGNKHAAQLTGVSIVLAAPAPGLQVGVGRAHCRGASCPDAVEAVVQGIRCIEGGVGLV